MKNLNRRNCFGINYKKNLKKQIAFHLKKFKMKEPYLSLLSFLDQNNFPRTAKMFKEEFGICFPKNNYNQRFIEINVKNLGKIQNDKETSSKLMSFLIFKE